MLNTVIHGDCLIEMQKIADKSIDLTVTSPPYDNLRTYNGSLDWNFEIFQGIAKELYRVTKDGGVVVWVVGDATRNFCESLTSFKQALYFVEVCGFNLLDTMIYAKQSYAPAYPSIKRYAQTFEYMFVFSKGSPDTFNPIRTYKQKSSISTKEESNGYRMADGSIKYKRMTPSNLTKQECNVWVYDVGFNKSSNDKIAFQHPAIFPEQLATDHILSWSNENDTVLDCFGGSGTTAIACMNTNRNYILIEKEQKYIDIINNRIENHRNLFTKGVLNAG